jgi:hypothetical protein
MLIAILRTLYPQGDESWAIKTLEKCLQHASGFLNAANELESASQGAKKRREKNSKAEERRKVRSQAAREQLQE